jgi:hypothetical protein
LIPMFQEPHLHLWLEPQLKVVVVNQPSF